MNEFRMPLGQWAKQIIDWATATFAGFFAGLRQVCP